MAKAKTYGEEQELRRWLKVPFDDRHKAKEELGARWDPLVRLWWVPAYTAQSRIPREWIIDPAEQRRKLNQAHGPVTVIRART